MSEWLFKSISQAKVKDSYLKYFYDFLYLTSYKRVAWPPVSEERIVREFTPQPQPQYQTVPTNNQHEQQQQLQQQQQQPHHQQQSYPGAAVPSIQLY
uniref:Uncharacterized protein n=1 Tax=Glossina pallidipes TaxID=7398 RepID=A0A1A9Z344_GLOPL